MGVGATDITTVAGKYVEIGSHQVGAKQEKTYGTGDAVDVDDRKTATIKLFSLGAELTAGTLRLSVADANLINVIPVHENLLANWSSGEKLELKSLSAGEDAFLKIQVNTTASHTLDFSNTSNQVDVPIVETNLGVN